MDSDNIYSIDLYTDCYRGGIEASKYTFPTSYRLLLFCCQDSNLRNSLTGRRLSIGSSKFMSLFRRELTSVTIKWLLCNVTTMLSYRQISKLVLYSANMNEFTDIVSVLSHMHINDSNISEVVDCILREHRLLSINYPLMSKCITTLYELGSISGQSLNYILSHAKVDEIEFPINRNTSADYLCYVDNIIHSIAV